ncbi:hypothetical protein PsAD46_01282 [Pseudovibrio sp. Ad46]|uniref:hypothetical protein n=1 Tax=Pseudovibrio sp. Ad46 TaxID=989432 RepID=UPI0007B27871|nr:hypothetical protein [Pseudovibrio sp. Ad46]KZK94030.1 hypothetical protein PsAD46_01282 [Pseudovibrio sp. Ad46]
MSRELAERFEAIGVDAYRSENERYLKRCRAGQIEVVELGRPVRQSRIFPSVSSQKNLEIVECYNEFIQCEGEDDLFFWTFAAPAGKCHLADLIKEYEAFSELVSAEVRYLKRTFQVDVHLLAFHPRYDKDEELFDLHIHFMGRVPLEYRVAALGYLDEKFPRVDRKDKPVESVVAAVTYMLNGVYPVDKVLGLPERPLKALWKLSQSKKQLVRKTGTFALWKRLNHPEKRGTRQSARNQSSSTPRMPGDYFIAYIPPRSDEYGETLQLWERIKP